MSRPKKMLPVLGQEPVEQEAPREAVDACSDDCCASEASPIAATNAVAGTGMTPKTREGNPEAHEGDLERTVVRVTGMDCASCAVTVERGVSRVPGVRRATVNFAAGRLDAEHGPGVDLAEIERAVESAGYGVERPGEAEAVSFWRQPKVLLTLAGTLLFALGAALGFSGAPGMASVGAYAAAIVVGGLPIFRAAVSSLRARHMDMNVLMSVAAVGAAGIGAWGEAALVVTLFAVGNALQVYAVDRTRGAVRALARLTPDEVLARRDGAERLVPVGEVAVGEVVVVRPGERVAVDGEVIEGSSALDESPVTGESTPAEKGVGDEVFSGSLNGQGGLLVRVTKEAGDSTLQKVARMVEEAQGTKAPVEQFVERFSRIYTPVVMAAAVAVAAVPPLLGADFSTWFYRALVLVLVACPCALVISTPVTVVSGIGAASRRGILIKGGGPLEVAGKLKTLFFDKTGTLTEGRPVVERVIPVGGVDEGEALRLAAALERRSEHPLAHAILTAAGKAGRELPEVTGFRGISGRGAEGEVEGRRYLVGSPRLFEEQGAPLEDAADALRGAEEAGLTPVILGTERGPLAVFGLADAIRPDAVSALAALREVGVEDLVMLTGDAEAPARRIADKLGIDYRARLLPEQKVEAVREMVAKGAGVNAGAVGMVGDGINDAPALAAADVSFAMGAAGSDVALEAADVALMSDDLSKLAEAVRFSRAAERIIKQNIFVSILLNGVFTVLAPFGLVPLWLAVLEDMVTSISVTGNGLRLFRKGDSRRRY